MNSIAQASEILPVAGSGRSRDWARFGKFTLQASAIFWFVVAVIGQLLFAFYVADFYGRTASHGQWQDWNQVLQAGYIPGDTLGNAVLAAHLLCAVAVTLCEWRRLERMQRSPALIAMRHFDPARTSSVKVLFLKSCPKRKRACIAASP